MIPNFDLESKFYREAVVSALKSVFFLKGMTLIFQELVLKKFWHQNSNFGIRICTARSGGDSTYVSTKKWPGILTLTPNLTGKRWSQLWNLFFPWKVWLLAFRNCSWKNFGFKTQILSPWFVGQGQAAIMGELFHILKEGLPVFEKFLQPNPLRYGHGLFRGDS